MWVGRYRLSKVGICTICMFLYYRVNQAWEIFFFKFFSDILPFYQPFEKSYFCIIGQNSKKSECFRKYFFYWFENGLPKIFMNRFTIIFSKTFLWINISKRRRQFSHKIWRTEQTKLVTIFDWDKVPHCCSWKKVARTAAIC